MLSLFFVDELSGSKIQILDGDEAHHAIKVMRFKIGEEIKFQMVKVAGYLALSLKLIRKV